MVSLSRNIETGTPTGGTPAGGLRQGLFFLFSFGILGLLLFSAAMKALFVFSDPFWSDRVPLHWFVFALLIPLELFVCVVTMRALFLVRIRGTSVLLGTTVFSIFSFAQVWHFFSDIESCYCFGNAEIPYPIQFGTCLFLAMTGVYLLVHCPSIGLDSFVRLPIRWDLLFWIVALFLSVVYFYRTDGGQVLAGFRSPSDLKFKLVDVKSAREKRTFVFEIRNEARKPITLVASRTSCNCVSTAALPIRLRSYEKALLRFAVKLTDGRQASSEFVRFVTDDPRQIQVKLELPADHHTFNFARSFP